MAASGRFASPSTTGASLSTQSHGMGSGRHQLVGEGANGEKRGLVGVKRTGQAREDDHAVVARPCRHRVAERGGACGEQAIRGGGNWDSVHGGEQARVGGRSVHFHRGGREGNCTRRSGDGETAGAGTECAGGGKSRGSSRQHDNGGGGKSGGEHGRARAEERSNIHRAGNEHAAEGTAHRSANDTRSSGDKAVRDDRRITCWKTRRRRKRSTVHWNGNRRHKQSDNDIATRRSSGSVTGKERDTCFPS
ncbi:hypothetical protein, conserved in T. vivax [Trypanosoma vivax Y486]|uniref:Uncharacterized protein n=1 Tax=Trypanosoma vivax (strain Y486) TaxID=1055687 RepID=F9WV92_TRYVY|nr:hypothetical protein, conserved in T. vivax [Trypanosoma vivax Y486]|eukprot:CCD21497.1 hypothetical protein, conserved in T. vivax [Trypanosoma vivax Y486]